MNGTNGVSGSGNNFNVRDYKNLKLPELKVDTTSTLSKTPLLSLNTFGRENLDEISPYAGMGLRLSAKAPAGSVESYMKAAPEFGRWQGSFGPLGKQELATLDNLGNVYARVAKDKAGVTEHLQNSPFDCFTA